MVLTGYVTGFILVIKCLIITLNFIFSYGSHRFDHGAYSSCESERGLQQHYKVPHNQACQQKRYSNNP